LRIYFFDLKFNGFDIHELLKIPKMLVKLTRLNMLSEVNTWLKIVFN